MEEHESYQRDGAALLKGVVAADMAGVLLAGAQQVVARHGERVLLGSELTDKKAYEFYGQNWEVLTALLWGLTPLMERVVGERLAPTYAYFRAYQAGDVCHVHSDREASEHSASITLGYADKLPWALAVGKRRVDPAERFKDRYTPDFGDEPYREFAMDVGDAVVYQGALYRHGRLKPNPNRWSAHLFLQWVGRDGPYSKHAFDGRPLVEPGEFVFPA